jgi:hypothetical protein
MNMRDFGRDNRTFEYMAVYDTSGRTSEPGGGSEAWVTNCCGRIECTANAERVCGDGNGDVLDVASERRADGV